MLVVDASIAVKMVTQEPGSDEASERVSNGRCAAPDFLYLEVASALAKKVRLAGLPVHQAIAALDALPQLLPDLHDAQSLVLPTLHLSTALDHAFYDCMYLALAEQLDAIVFTADSKFAKSAQRAGYGGRVELLTC